MEKEVNNKKRLIIFFVIVFVIVILTILLVLISNKLKSNNNVDNDVNIDSIDNIDFVNPYMESDDKPSIAGNENINVENGIKTNNSNKISEERNVGIYKFSDIKIQSNSNGTVFTAKVSTSSSNKESGKDFIINFYDNDGKLVSKMNIYVGQIKPNETFNLRAESTSDLANAYDLEIVEK